MLAGNGNASSISGSAQWVGRVRTVKDPPRLCLLCRLEEKRTQSLRTDRLVPGAGHG